MVNITSMASTFFNKKRGAFLNGNDRAKYEKTVYFEPTLVDPLNMEYGIPMTLTAATDKYFNTKEIVIKALATTPITDIVGFTKLIDQTPDLYFTIDRPFTVWKGAKGYCDFFVLIEDGETITKGALLEFVPANNTYQVVTTGVGIVRALEDGAGGDLLAVESLIKE